MDSEELPVTVDNAHHNDSLLNHKEAMDIVIFSTYHKEAYRATVRNGQSIHNIICLNIIQNEMVGFVKALAGVQCGRL